MRSQSRPLVAMAILAVMLLTAAPRCSPPPVGSAADNVRPPPLDDVYVPPPSGLPQVDNAVATAVDGLDSADTQDVLGAACDILGSANWEALQSSGSLDTSLDQAIEIYQPSDPDLAGRVRTLAEELVDALFIENGNLVGAVCVDF